jgi:ubiquinone/menaquinone biosynthesis C-methylase UbiE
VERLTFGPGFHAAADRRVDVDAYDNYLGRWSRLFVPTLLAAAAIHPGASVLDLATGTGEAASQLHRGMVFGTDISESMLRAARSRGAHRVVVGNAQALPFAHMVFDAVICQLGLQFFPDPVGALRETVRVLRSDGRGAFSTLGPPDRAPMWGYLAEALADVLPGQRDLLVLSFSLSDPNRLAALLQRAGFRNVQVTTEVRHGSLGSIETYWRDVERGIGMLPQAYRALPNEARARVRQQVSGQLTTTVSLEVLIATGRR